MILGVGSDLVEIARIRRSMDRFAGRFLQRCFSTAEREWVEKQPAVTRPAAYAKRWAAKEAAAKALGVGIAEGVYLRDIQVVRNKAGRPEIVLTGGARACLERLTPPGMKARIHASLSDDAGFALAFVVIEGM